MKTRGEEGRAFALCIELLRLVVFFGKAIIQFVTVLLLKLPLRKRQDCKYCEQQSYSFPNAKRNELLLREGEQLARNVESFLSDLFQ